MKPYFTPPKKPRPEYEALVERIARGEISRNEAADIAQEQTGASRQTFLSWVRTSGNSERLKDVRGNAGSNSIHAHKDPAIVAAYDAALKLAVSGKVSIRQAAKVHNVSYPWLLTKVRKYTEPV